MNLAKLFEAQKVLRERINYNEPDRFDKLKLSLLVEVGECANEWRGFKFWSKKPFPKPPQHNWVSSDDGTEQHWEPGMGYTSYPLLEEYVDGLHFVLELGLEIHSTNFEPSKLISFHDTAISNDFLSIYSLIAKLDHATLLFNDSDYRILFNNYIKLGELLGFTWEEIETAYFEKNQINHERQRTGY